MEIAKSCHRTPSHPRSAKLHLPYRHNRMWWQKITTTVLFLCTLWFCRPGSPVAGLLYYYTGLVLSKTQTSFSASLEELGRRKFFRRGLQRSCKNYMRTHCHTFSVEHVINMLIEVRRLLFSVPREVHGNWEIKPAGGQGHSQFHTRVTT